MGVGWSCNTTIAWAAKEHAVAVQLQSLVPPGAVLVLLVSVKCQSKQIIHVAP